MHQRPTPSLPTLPCAVAEARLSDVVAPFRPCRARTRARRCWATAVPTARSGCRPCAPLLAVWCPTSPPSPLPHHTGFKTGVAPSPPPFLLLEHDSSDACPHRPSPIAVTGKPQKLPLFKPPSPSPPPPRPTVSSTRAPFFLLGQVVPHLLVPSSSCRASLPPSPPTRLCRCLGTSTSRRHSPPPPHRRQPARVSPSLRHLVRRHPQAPLVLKGKTLPTASRHRAHTYRAAGRFPGWAGLGR
jgi:hypothetical protein